MSPWLCQRKKDSFLDSGSQDALASGELWSGKRNFSKDQTCLGSHLQPGLARRGHNHFGSNRSRGWTAELPESLFSRSFASFYSSQQTPVMYYIRPALRAPWLSYHSRPPVCPPALEMRLESNSFGLALCRPVRVYVQGQPRAANPSSYSKRRPWWTTRA